MRLDFTSLEKALNSLHRAILRSQASPGDEELRDAVIQRFEYSYELCWKMLKRRLEQDVPDPSGIDRLSFRELLREAAERGYVQDVERWMDYRGLRNITAHTYDEQKARDVHQAAVEFYDDARVLLKALQSGNHDSSEA
jgi:nucleotidyltransferase substrate binding protein (TIGR01987 family)